MRTTVSIDERLLRGAREAALRSNRSLSALLEEGVRLVLRQQKRAHSATRIHVVTFGEGGLQPGVDLDDGAALLDVMERAGDPL